MQGTDEVKPLEGEEGAGLEGLWGWADPCWSLSGEGRSLGGSSQALGHGLSSPGSGPALAGATCDGSWVPGHRAGPISSSQKCELHFQDCHDVMKIRYHILCLMTMIAIIHSKMTYWNIHASRYYKMEINVYFELTANVLLYVKCISVTVRNNIKSTAIFSDDLTLTWSCA